MGYGKHLKSSGDFLTPLVELRRSVTKARGLFGREILTQNPRFLNLKPSPGNEKESHLNQRFITLGSNMLVFGECTLDSTRWVFSRLIWFAVWEDFLCEAQFDARFCLGIFWHVTERPVVYLKGFWSELWTPPNIEGSLPSTYFSGANCC